MVLYGTSVTLRLRKHTPGTAGLPDSFAEIILNLYVPEVAIKEQLSTNESEMIGSIGRRGENPKITVVHRLASTEGIRRRAQAYNVQIRGCALRTQNVDK
jgi:hypothetical protein